MEFEKAMRQASAYLAFDPMFIDPAEPQGLWIMDTPEEVALAKVNAVCLTLTADVDDIVKCRDFIKAFPYMVIVAPNPIARERMVQQLRPRLPDVCMYQITDEGFRGCRSLQDFVDMHGLSQLPDILAGAEELPAFGLLNLAAVPFRDMSNVPRTLSRFPRLDAAIGGFYAGELSVWTGKRGAGKSTIIGQLLLEAIDQGHVVCAYSGELPAEQFGEWIAIQAAGPEHLVTVTDKATGKKLVRPDAMSEKLIREWMWEKFMVFDLEQNTRHSPEAILRQFEYAKMRYGADVFLVDNIMTVDFDGRAERDFYRIQSDFVRQLVAFSKRNKVHTHLVVHPRKASADSPGKITADDVSGSGDITNRADNVFFLTTHGASDEKGKPTSKPILQVLKNRDFGVRGSQWLDFDKTSRRFFADNVGDPAKPFGWDFAAHQITVELPFGEELDEISTEEEPF